MRVSPRRVVRSGPRRRARGPHRPSFTAASHSGTPLAPRHAASPRASHRLHAAAHLRGWPGRAGRGGCAGPRAAGGAPLPLQPPPSHPYSHRAFAPKPAPTPPSSTPAAAAHLRGEWGPAGAGSARTAPPRGSPTDAPTSRQMSIRRPRVRRPDGGSTFHPTPPFPAPLSPPFPSQPGPSGGGGEGPRARGHPARHVSARRTVMAAPPRRTRAAQEGGDGIEAGGCGKGWGVWGGGLRLRVVGSCRVFVAAGGVGE